MYFELMSFTKCVSLKERLSEEKMKITNYDVMLKNWREGNDFLYKL